MRNPLSVIVIALIRAYRALAPFTFSFGGMVAYSGCRFPVTCSQYAEHAITSEGLWRGGRRALGRLAQCHSFGFSRNIA